MSKDSKDDLDGALLIVWLLIWLIVLYLYFGSFGTHVFKSSPSA